jgi:hypothetical protein
MEIMDFMDGMDIKNNDEQWTENVRKWDGGKDNDERRMKTKKAHP